MTHHLAGHAAAHVQTGPGADGLPAVVWRFATPRAVLSSSPVGGHHAVVAWVVNTRVGIDYHREDLDVHAGELAEHFGLAGPGLAMFTAADVRNVASSTVGGVTVDVTLGIGKPTWAADPSGSWSAAPSTVPPPGTINIVAQFPVALQPAAAVNAVITITEAKTQALLERGVPGTGTASDAVTVCWPDAPGTEAFCGPRSRFGAPLALATHAAVLAGIEAQRRWEATTARRDIRP